MRNETKEQLRSYLYSICPVIYINYSDFDDVDAELIRIVPDARFVEFNNALGALNFKDKHPMQRCSLEEFLNSVMDDGFDEDRELMIVLKDVQESLNNPSIISLLRRIAERYNREDYKAKVIIIAPDVTIPKELKSFVTLMDIPLPDDEEIKECLNEFIKDYDLDIDDTSKGKLAFSLKGLSSFQIRQVLSLAYQDDGTLEASDTKRILEAKQQIVKKSGILEMMNFKEKLNDIGGLENLKKWLERKADIFKRLDEAIDFGVDVPRGILILGMPGCGKSLAAKATAALFEVPLVRLDIGRLMGKYVGESEGNMRRALALAETVSPCVLWIDELEKAFAGVNGNGGEVTTRLFGNFLTWMQEQKKDSKVFIVATANKIDKLPPEFLRKGRFDELFRVKLPNKEEREDILRIHLMNRKKWKGNGQINLKALAEKTDGFNGADLEGVVKEAVETAFLEKKEITTELLMDILNNTKSITDIQGPKIKELEEKLDKLSIKDASKS